jgi:ubiquinone biosynthesis monooxygenase Coq7
MRHRNHTPLDRAIVQMDQGLRTLFGRPESTGRTSPAAGVPDSGLAEGERRHAAGLLRVDHAGEVCAQALYQGQALTARLPRVRQSMERAAQEENDHLLWCEQRLDELGDHKSRLNPLWYAGSLMIGAIAGAIGDKWSLGFVAETERQVVRHLDRHLRQLPSEDARSRVILEQMRDDEGRHGTQALRAGGATLPSPVRRLMRLTSKVMTWTAYWI